MHSSLALSTPNGIPTSLNTHSPAITAGFFAFGEYMRALKLFSRTSSDRTFNLASWHSPHSLTWRWVLSLRRHEIMWPKLYIHANSVGFGAGLGTLLSFHAYRNNGGWQWGLCALWHGLNFDQQRPMWFKDMCRRAWDERDALERENRKLRRQIDLIEHNAARDVNAESLAHLN